MNDDVQQDLPPTQGRVAALAKLYTPVFKQLITLDASAIGLVLIFMDKFKSGDALINAVVAFALLAFLGSLLGSFMMHFRMTMMQLPDEGEKLFEDVGEWIIFWIAFLGFLGGVLSLMVVAWFNFYSQLPAWVIGLAGLVMIGVACFVTGRRIGKMRSRQKSQ